jgi:hypothetical protein
LYFALLLIFLTAAKKHIVIAFVRGKFVVKNPAQVVVDVNGVGYECKKYN